ncbi:unnamed protein product [Adineta steineri]|uniref:Uncharacterized protein n=1 Tax=Adineta steineri TaxID=433720 RepID=A0A818VXS0_9BILA|nr:unnamed protein product [Adineta steineri]
MLEAGVKVDQEFSTGGNGDTQRSAFMFACHSGSLTTIRALLNAVSNGLEMVFPIHFAIARDNLEMARQIVTSPNEELEIHNLWEPFRHGGFSPLHIACLFNRSLAMIELLLSFGEAEANPVLRTCSRGMFADQMTSDQTVIEYLRPKRSCIIAAL